MRVTTAPSTGAERALDALAEAVSGNREDLPIPDQGDETNVEYVARLWARFGLPEPEMFHAHGDDVVVHADFSAGEEPRPMWLLCRFDGRRLAHAIAFDDEVEALEATRALARR